MPLRDDLLNPIAGASPGGIDLLEDPVYLQLKEARREDDVLPQGDWEHKRKTADYALVIKLASETLAKKSKDLWVAAWLSEALLRREGFGGLREGLDLIRALLEGFWDHLYPELEDGDAELRAAPLSWVGLYLEPAVKSVPLNKSGHGFFQYMGARTAGYEADAEADPARKEAREEAIAAGRPTLEEFHQGFDATPKPFYKQLAADLRGCLATLKVLDEFGEAKFGEVAPNYRKLRQALTDVQEGVDDLLAKKLEVDPDPPELEPMFDETGATMATAESEKGLPVEPVDANDAAARIAAAAGFLQRQEPTNPASYLLLRGFRWGELRVQGGELDPKLLSAPPTQVRTHLKTLLLDEKWDQLLQECERVMAMPHGRGWLDLQRYVLTACYKLGSEYDYVAAAILGSLTALLRDLPQLPELTLMDDTPTANEETRDWLAGVLGDADELPDFILPSKAAVSEAGRPGTPALDRAMVEVRGGKPDKAIEILMAEVEREKSERARFLSRSEIAGIMVDAGHEAVAMPILKELLQKVESHRLEEWEEGGVVARPMGLLYRCMEALGESDSTKHDLYLRICRLDPVQAIGFPGGAAKAGKQDAGAADSDVRVVDLSAGESPVDDG
ncbi:MAG: type VI secretion system protein TssA [Gemmatimonadota bacterium]|nr:MAG: type VI secretion system protein TssA [Gemmatimonadota bacterium]